MTGKHQEAIGESCTVIQLTGDGQVPDQRRLMGDQCRFDGINREDQGSIGGLMQDREASEGVSGVFRSVGVIWGGGGLTTMCLPLPVTPVTVSHNVKPPLLVVTDDEQTHHSFLCHFSVLFFCSFSITYLIHIYPCIY